MKRQTIFLLLSFMFYPPFLMASPDLSHAVGQMMMVGFDGTTINSQSGIVKAIKNYHIGGVILFDHHLQKQHGKWIPRNIINPTQLKNLTQQLQYYAKKYHDFPLLIAVNQEGGIITSLKSEKGFHLKKDFSQQALGKMNNLRSIYDQALDQGRLLKSLGINLNFAPVADLDLNPNNLAVGKLERSFGENPQKVTQDLMTAIKGYRAANVFCTLKHFPGLGSSLFNTDHHLSDVTSTWKKIELYPYKKLIARRECCEFIMTSHSINRQLDPSGLEASLSYKIVTELLRDKLHFNGIIITDDMDAVAIRKHMPVEQAIRLAVLAGNNIILYGGTQGYESMKDAQLLYDTMMLLATKDDAIRYRVFRSYGRIVRLKEVLDKYYENVGDPNDLRTSD